jgi:hypothetical protein
MKSIHVLLSLSLLAPFSMASAETTAKTHTEKTETDGTKVTTEYENKTSQGILGGSQKNTEESTVVVDPKGMMNKTTVERKTVRKVEDDGDYRNVDSKTNEAGTYEEVKSKKTTAKHWTDDGKKTTTSYKHTVDPKGLGNKQTVEVVEKNDVSPGEKTERTVTKKVNGETVSEVTTER